MPSTFLGLNIGYSGLNAANAALNTTGNNISNKETKGYSRQTVTQQASDALRIFTTYGCIGAGVDTIAIERQRNEFYDTKYWNNSTVLGEYDKKQYYMEEIENYFMDEKDKLPGFTTIFNKMYDALQNVKNNSGDKNTKAAFISAAKSLASYFNTASGNLQKVQADANSEIKTLTTSINALASQIATLNKQINTIELTGVMANELRDQRTLIVDQLSKIVDVKVTEDPIKDSNNPERVTGANRYLVTIGSGQTLVDMYDYNELECVARKDNEKINQSDIDGLYDIVWKKTGTDFGMYNASLGGSLRGLIDIRDGNNNANFQGKASAIGSTVVNGDTHQTVTVDVTLDYLKDLSKCTLPDSGGTITIGNTEYLYDSWTYDSTTDPPSYTFVLSADNTQFINGSALNKEAEVGKSIDYKGVPHYMEQMNEWIRSFASAFNSILTQTGSVDSYGDPATILLTGTSANGQYGLTTSINGASVSSTDDSYYKLTALNFAVSSSIESDPGKLATHTGATDGQDKYDVIDDLIGLKTNKSKMSFRGGSASEFLESILSDISLSAGKANTGYLNYTNVSNTIQNQRLSVSGVDEDEEALNLVKFQNAFTLASKMISVMTECYDRLILSTGV